MAQHVFSFPPMFAYPGLFMLSTGMGQRRARGVLGTMLGGSGTGAVTGAGGDDPNAQRFSYVPNAWNAPVKPVSPGKRYGWSPAPWNPNGD
jgi:hypothetical protein